MQDRGDPRRPGSPRLPQATLTRRGFLLGGTCLAAAAAEAFFRRTPAGAASDAARTWAVTRTRAERLAAQPDAVFRVETDERMVGLSFDDGPDPRYTPHVLDLLDHHRARATFFIVGVNAVAHPALLARQVASGHSIGNHTYDHRELELLDSAQVRREIQLGAEAIRKAGGPPLWLFRPPKGYTDQAVGVLADAERYRTVFWEFCLERFIEREGISPGVDAILHHATPGSIILAHDGGHILAPGRPTLDRSSTMKALPLLLKGLEHKGLRVVDIPTLLRSARPTDR